MQTFRSFDITHSLNLIQINKNNIAGAKWNSEHLTILPGYSRIATNEPVATNVKIRCKSCDHIEDTTLSVTLI